MALDARRSRHRFGKTFFGARMQLDTRDYIQRRIWRFGVYEPNLTYYILQRVRPGEHAVDAGANVGYMTLLLSAAVGPGGHVTAIEPGPATFAALQRNLALNAAANVTALNMAATAGPGQVEIVPGERDNCGSNGVRPSDAGIPADALSNMAAIEAGRVSFVKIDVEGSETPILENLLANLRRFPALRSIAAEMTQASAGVFERLVQAGFRAYAFPNNYSIGYLLVREYLRRSNEHGFVVKHPIDQFDPHYWDFVFER